MNGLVLNLLALGSDTEESPLKVDQKQRVKAQKKEIDMHGEL